MDLLEFKILQNKLLAGESLNLRVASDSMVPLLKVGELIKVKKADIDSLQKFDVIVFFQDDKLMCHFLWSIQGDHLITKSLKDPTRTDWPIKETLLLGKTDVKVPLLSKIKVWLLN